MRKMRNVWITVLCFVLVSSILVKGECEKESIEGVITDIDTEALQITVTKDDGTTVQVDAADAKITITKKAVKTVIPFDELVEGMTVRVCGMMVNDVLEADNINVKYGGAIIDE